MDIDALIEAAREIDRSANRGEQRTKRLGGLARMARDAGPDELRRIQQESRDISRTAVDLGGPIAALRRALRAKPKQFAEIIEADAAEIDRLRKQIDEMESRERQCQSMDEAEKIALVRFLQAIIGTLGLIDPSPADICAAIHGMRSDAARYKFFRDRYEWRRDGSAIDGDLHAFVGCRFDWFADFSCAAVLDHQIDREINKAAQRGEGE